MRVFQLPNQLYQAFKLAHNITDLSQTAQERLAKIKAVHALREKGVPTHEAVTVVGISKATYYRWEKALGKGPKHLEPIPTTPKKKPQKTARTRELKAAVLAVREKFPTWSKYKIQKYLENNGTKASVSSIGRLLSEEFKAKRIPTAYQLRNGKKAKRSMRRRPHAVRMKKKPELTEPGQLLQVDSMTVTLAPGVIIKLFNASCPVSKWSVGQVFSQATATCAQKFLTELLERLPFPVRGIQVDGGSEFMAEFEEACRTRALPLYVLPPYSPKLNGSVERCNGSWRYEFFQNEELPLTIRELREAVRQFEQHFNSVRPHQGLAYLTPQQYLTQRERASTQNVS